MLTLKSFKVFFFFFLIGIFIVVCLFCVQFRLFSSMLFVSDLMLQEGSLSIATVLRIGYHRVRLHRP